MKLSAFRTRILVGAVFVATMAFFVVVATVRIITTPVDWQPRTFSAQAHAACRAAPEVWRELHVGRTRVQAVERLHDIAPGLQLQVGESRSLDDLSGRFLITRYAEAGPCAYVALRLQPPNRLVTLVPLGLAVGAFIAVLAVALATNAFTVTPLLRRIDRIRSAAVGVGGSGYRSENDRVGDALSDIAEVLDASHDRILSDRAELVRRHEALERYMAELAHDLRVPLSSLLLALQEVEVAAPTAHTPIRRAFQDATYVSGLVENLHNATRLRHGLDPLEGRTDLCEVVSRLEVRFAAIGRVEDVEVGAARPESPVLVQCSPDLVERAIGNLVQNAVVHGGRHVAVLLKADAERFTLQVIDDGEGLSPVACADLAKRTFADDEARPRSAGLGIAITNEVARRAGWSITYERALQGGLQVCIEGPVSKSCRSPVGPPAEASADCAPTEPTPEGPRSR
ncbi:MAG: HAMP domain-containing sensor histidine kinase [Myxococcota bacterium]